LEPERIRIDSIKLKYLYMKEDIAWWHIWIKLKLKLMNFVIFTHHQHKNCRHHKKLLSSYSDSPSIFITLSYFMWSLWHYFLFP
jgi:hypothetical protein